MVLTLALVATPTGAELFIMHVPVLYDDDIG